MAVVVLLLLLVLLSQPFLPSSAYQHTYNGTLSNSIYYANRFGYADRSCGSAIITQEQLRIGDANNCFQIVQANPALGSSFRLNYARRDFIVTTVYLDNACKEPLKTTPAGLPSYSSLKLGGCMPDLENKGQSYRIQVNTKANATLAADALAGYVETIYPSSNTGCAAASSQPVMRRVFAEQSCFAFPNPGFPQSNYQYKCKEILTQKNDRIYSTTIKIQPCGDSLRFAYKTYLPPPQCMALGTPDYPGSARVFLKFTAPSNHSDVVVSLSGYHQSISCDNSGTSIVTTQFQEYQYQWYVRTASCSLSLLGSLAVIGIILVTPKWTDANMIILALSVAQLAYDASFYSPYPTNYTDLTTQSFTQAGYLSGFFWRLFSLATLLCSNILACTMTYIIASRKGFKLKGRLVYFLVVIAFISVGPTLPLLLIDIGTLPDPTSAMREMCLQVFTSIQVFAVFVNAFSYIFFMYKIFSATSCFRVAMDGFTEDAKGSNTKALYELSNRVVFYPLVQFVTQGPVIWVDSLFYFRKAYSTTAYSDDEIKQLNFVIYNYLYALLTPLAGTAFCYIYVRKHPGAWEKIKLGFRKTGAYLFPGPDLEKMLQAEMTAPNNHWSPPHNNHDHDANLDLYSTSSKQGLTLADFANNAEPPHLTMHQVRELDDDEIVDLIDVHERFSLHLTTQRQQNFPSNLKSFYSPTPDHHLGENVMLSDKPGRQGQAGGSGAVINPLSQHSLSVDKTNTNSAVNARDHLPSDSYLQQTYGHTLSPAPTSTLTIEQGVAYPSLSPGPGPGASNNDQLPPTRLRAFTPTSEHGGVEPLSANASPGPPMQTPPPRPPPPRPAQSPASASPSLSPNPVAFSPGPPSGSPPPRPPPPPPKM